MRVAGHHQAVEGADRRAEDEVGHDVVLEERAEHADLDRPQQPAPAEHEGGARSPIGQAGTRSGCSRRTLELTLRSTQKIKIGSSPASSTSR